MLFKTPVGTLTLGYIGKNIICEFGERKVDSEPSKKLAQQMKSYLEGKSIQCFDVETPVGPPFTSRCWEACKKIKYGETTTYHLLAKKAGSPKAARAAGQAMRANPTVILTPCHRVIATSGKLHGFAGSTHPDSPELKQKQFLLSLEASTIDV
jgi:methylated-DNA-[protein]-cysteine S-methyltransferase